jgi:hypothetical protein
MLGIKYVSHQCEEDIFALLADRTIALVGNAASLSATCHGASIDAHDIVIRMNAAPLPSEVSHGARTTVIATSIVLKAEVVKTRGAAQVFMMSPEPTYVPGWLKNRRDLFIYPKFRHVALMDELGARPTTGMMVVDLLRRSPCAKVNLYGFDFFSSASLSNARTPKSSPHDFIAEKTFVTGLLQCDRRFHLNS